VVSFCSYKWKEKVFIFLLPLFIYFLVDLAAGQDSPGLAVPLVLGGLGGLSFAKKRSFKFFIIWSSLILTFLYVSNYYYLVHYKKIDLLEKSRLEIIELVESSQKVVPEVNSETEEELTANFKEVLDLFQDNIWIEMAKNTLVFSYFLYALFLSLGVYFILGLFWKYSPQKLTSKEEKGVGYYKGIIFFRLNDFWILILIINWAFFLLVDKIDYKGIYLIALNLSLIISVFYLIQGVGVIKFFLWQKKLPVSLLYLSPFFMLLLGVEVFLLFLIFLFGLGILDWWSDLRKLKVDLK